MPLTRREFIKTGLEVGAGVGASALFSGDVRAAEVSDVPRSLPSEPRHLYRDGEVSDFQRHLDNKRRFGSFTLGGTDLVFGDGTPLWSLCRGHVKWAHRNTDDGRITFIDCGIVQIVISHQKEMYIKAGDDGIIRMTIIGWQGKDGSGAKGYSHVHITVFGNAILCADEKRRLPKKMRHSYVKSKELKGKYGGYNQWERELGLTGPGVTGKDSDTPYHWNFVLDPDKLTPDRETPLHSAFWDPFDPEQDYDTPYLDFVESRIKGGLQDIASRWQRKSNTRAQQFGRKLEMQVISMPLYDVINSLWVMYETKLKKRDKGQKGYGLKILLEPLFDEVRAAVDLIKLTSPYIDPSRPDIIKYMMQKNPQHRDLIMAYYGRFLKK